MLQANAVYFERIFDNNYLEGIYRHYNPLRTDVPFAEMVHTFEGIFFKRIYQSLNLKGQVFFVKWQQMIIMILLGSLMLIIVEKQML